MTAKDRILERLEAIEDTLTVIQETMKTLSAPREVKKARWEANASEPSSPDSGWWVGSSDVERV